MLNKALYLYAIAGSIAVFFLGFDSWQDGTAAALSWMTAGGYQIDNEQLGLYMTGSAIDWIENKNADN